MEQNSLNNVYESAQALPSYETMIVEALERLNDPHGSPPKDIYTYMMQNWSLLPNFRPSASQALKRALERGRLKKKGPYYTLNPEWQGGHTVSESNPSRHITRRPGSVFQKGSDPLTIKRDDRRHLPPADNHEASETLLTDTKATAHAAASLLRSIAQPITSIISFDDQSNTARQMGIVSLETTENRDPEHQLLKHISRVTSSSLKDARRPGRPATGITPRLKTPRSTIPPPLLIPLNTHHDAVDERRTRKSLLASLEALLSQLNQIRAKNTNSP